MPSSDSIWLADRHWLMLAMIGMPPATEASNAIDRPSSRARSNSSGPCSASSALLAVTTSLPLSSSCSMIVRSGSSPPTRLGDDLDLRIVDHLVDVVGEHALGQVAIAGLLEVADDRLFEPQRAAGVPRRAVAVVQQQLRDALPDGAQADDRDLGFFHRATSVLQLRLRTFGTPAPGYARLHRSQ